MLIRNIMKAEYQTESIHKGVGICKNARVFSGDDIPAPVRFIYYTVLPPKASFGVHKHGNDNEFYVILEGAGMYRENGKDVAVHKGDIIMNDAFAEHGITNTSDQDMHVLVFEVSIDGPK